MITSHIFSGRRNLTVYKVGPTAMARNFELSVRNINFVACSVVNSYVALPHTFGIHCTWSLRV
jgi:hypothetical protein